MLPIQKTSVKPLLVKKVDFTPKNQIKYAEQDYVIGNTRNVEMACAQERLADRLNGETRIVLKNVEEFTSKWQREVEMQIRERLEEVQFLYDESVKQRKMGSLEREALETYAGRIKIALETVEKSILVSKKCLKVREGRIGIDLCVDEVEKQLIQELKTMEGAQDLLEKLSQEVREQLRSLRESIFILDEDIKHKLGAIQIDKNNMNLYAELSTLGQSNDLSANFCKYTLMEWKEMSGENLKKNIKEIQNAATLRVYTDVILKQAYEDLCEITERTNFVFKRRIEETTKIKRLLEDRHNNCNINITQVSKNIQDLEDQIRDKERSLLLCQTRLSNRARRWDMEKTCDWGQEALNLEHNALQVGLCQLKQKLSENKGALRYLMHTNLIEEEEINVKANSLKIDDVECGVLRESLKFVMF